MRKTTRSRSTTRRSSGRLLEQSDRGRAARSIRPVHLGDHGKCSIRERAATGRETASTSIAAAIPLAQMGFEPGCARPRRRSPTHRPGRWSLARHLGRPTWRREPRCDATYRSGPSAGRVRHAHRDQEPELDRRRQECHRAESCARRSARRGRKDHDGDAPLDQTGALQVMRSKRRRTTTATSRAHLPPLDSRRGAGEETRALPDCRSRARPSSRRSGSPPNDRTS